MTSMTGVSPLKETVFGGNQDAYDAGLLFVSMISAGIFDLASKSPGVCFVAGTKVSTENGPVAIETIKPGDMVWAEDPETGEKALKRVVQTFVNETDELVHLSVNDEEITTPEHPFYVPQKGWTNANELNKGDTLVLQIGKYVTVESIRQEKQEGPVTVYNFEVEDFHTYFVGESNVLVHNACKNTAMREAKRSENIPMNQKPTTIITEKAVLGANGQYYQPQTQIFGNKFIRNDFGGHLFLDRATLPPHFNAGSIINGNSMGNGRHFWYER